ncbi:hypothetical protein [Fructobacillus tropaeoli]|uniref:hypothetical protein n=1 Tax=Fructobacillus tropaeoli TaxID=709323 RepID=UPI0030C81930
MGKKAILEHFYQSYADDLKLEIIQKVLGSTHLIRSLALEYTLPSHVTLSQNIALLGAS